MPAWLARIALVTVNALNLTVVVQIAARQHGNAALHTVIFQTDVSPRPPIPRPDIT